MEMHSPWISRHAGTVSSLDRFRFPNHARWHTGNYPVRGHVLADAGMCRYKRMLADYYSGQGAVLNQDGTVNSRFNPARLGTVVAIFATGGGLLNPLRPDGSITPIQPPFPQLTLPIKVLFGGGAGRCCMQAPLRA